MTPSFPSSRSPAPETEAPTDAVAPIRLLLVDDHNLFRRGLVALLSHDPRFVIAGESADANAALVDARRLQPDLVLLDNHLPGVNGVDAIAGLKEVAPQARVLMLTVSENEDDLAAGLRAGADGYLLKTINTDDLADSIVRVWEGDAVISPDMMGKMVALLRGQPLLQPHTASEAHGVAAAMPAADRPKEASASPNVSASLAQNDPIHSLSPREREILQRIAKGDSNKHIARAFNIAETTVKIHVQHILRKLDLNNRVHAAVYASERGLG